MTPPSAHAFLPASCGVAFKEWAGICQALADGRQVILLRKGGIAEGPGGFRPEHPAFWMLPTGLHEGQQGLKPGSPSPSQGTPPGFADLELLAVVEAVAWWDRAESLAALDDHHVWTEETVLKRFHYRSPGLWVLGVRIFRRDRPHRVAITPEMAGCRTWVPLDEPIATDGLTSVLDPGEAHRRWSAWASALSPETSPTHE